MPRSASFMLLLAAACGTAGEAGVRETDQVVAIVNVTVVPMDAERHIPAQTVLIRDGAIDELGSAAIVQIPAGARSIDGTGLYLMPGLIDTHVHLRDQSELLSYLAHGVTSIAHLGGPAGNVPDVSALRDSVVRGAVPGPSIYASGPVIDGDPAIFPAVSVVVRTPQEAGRIVSSQLAAGADFVKVYNNLAPDPLRAVVAAAHAHGATVWGHVPRAAGRATALQQAIAAGMDVIAHAEEVFFTLLYRDVERQLDEELVPSVDEALVLEAVRLIREGGVAVVPNLSFVAMTRAQLDDVQSVMNDPEARFLHPAVLGMWRRQNPTTRPDLDRFDRRERGKQVVVRRLTRALHDAGVPLFLGTDASAPGMFPGSSAHMELAELVAIGLTPYLALATATRHPGEFLARRVPEGPRLGTVAVGSRADLLLLDADPLSDVANAARIAGVVVRGRWYERSQLDSMRHRIR